MPCEEIDESDAQFSLKIPHVDGLQVLAYSPDGRSLYSGGADTFIRVHSSDNFDGEPHLIEHVNAPVTSLHCSFDNMAASYESGEVCLFSHEAPHDLTGFITRANPGAVPHCVRFGYNGRKMALASDELEVKVIDTRDTTQVQLLPGHDKAVVGLGWNPDGSILVSSSCDGTLRVWDLSTDAAEPACLRVLKDIVQPGEPGSATSTAEAHWHPSGRFFVVASKLHDIVMISSDGFERVGAFDQDGHTADICAMAWSPNGNYLVSADTAQQVIVWETSSKQPIYKVTHSSSVGQDSARISALLWQPGTGGNAIAIADTSGQLVHWTTVIPSSKSHPSDGPSLYGRSSTTEAGSLSEAAALATKTGAQQPQAGPSRPRPAAAASLLGDDEDDGWIDDDMNGAYNDPDDDDEEGLPPALAVNGDRGGRANGLTARRPAGLSTSGGLTLAGSGQAPQPTFQPGSTPWKEKRRYLAFNHIGLIHAVDRDIHHLITVEFHDRSAHRGYHFDDNYKFTMASLGEHGALYACPVQDDMPSVVHYRPYESWTMQADWHLNLPQNESAVAIAVGGVPSTMDHSLKPATGNGCCAVATSKGNIRFLTTSGIQVHVVDLGGQDVVAMAMGREWLFVAHRSHGVVQDGRQNLDYTIFDCDTFEIIQQGHVPLPRGVKLQWAGFTEDQLPAIYKSDGVLSFLQRSRRPFQARWAPALDTTLLERREGKQESYWPVSVSSAQLHYIILKGEEKHPFFPTPLLQEMSLQMPVANLDSQQGQLEENFMRDTLISGHLKDGLDPHDRSQRTKLNSITLDIDRHLLKLMQIACKADKLEQALDAARLLGQPQSLEAASKLAAFFHQRGLQERIELLKEARSGESSMEKDRRDSKWGHLVDNRTIVDSAQEALGYSSRDAAASVTRTTNSLSKPVELSGASKRSLGDGSALGQMPARAPPVLQHTDSGLATSSDPPEYDTTMPIEEEEEDQQQQHDQDEEGTQLVDSPAQTPLPQVVPGPKSKAANPFAKQNKAATAGPPPTSSNPFAKKASAKQTDLKRSDSFFDRVEGTTPAKKGSGGGKQSTLFGKAPPAVAETTGSKKKGANNKKRKASENSDESGSASASSGLAKFLYKSTSTPAEVLDPLDEASEEAEGDTSKRQRTEEAGAVEAED